METGTIAKQMINFNKTVFDNSFNAMGMLQDQTEKMMNTLIGQAAWLPEEGKKAINDWVQAYRNGSEDFKKVVDESFKKVEDSLK